MSVVWFSKKEPCNKNRYIQTEVSWNIPQIASPIYSVSYPAGQFYMGVGYMGYINFNPDEEVVAWRLERGWDEVYGISLWAAPGSSGSPIFQEGKLVGLTVGGWGTEGSEIALMIPIHFLEDLY